MGLHTTIATRTIKLDPPYRFEPEEDEDEEDFDEEQGECPECGIQAWSRRVYGRYSQSQYYTFGQSRYLDYDDLDTELYDDCDSWQCDNGHDATDEIAEMLNDV
jgi:hypothetical protein